MKKKDTTTILDDKIVAAIDKLTREEMSRLWRYAPVGHIYFDATLPYYKIFEKRFDDLNGMSPEISKKIGQSK